MPGSAIRAYFLFIYKILHYFHYDPRNFRYMYLFYIKMRYTIIQDMVHNPTNLSFWRRFELKRNNNLFVLFVVIVSVLSFSITASAATSDQSPPENGKQVVKVVNYPEERNFDKLVDLALQQKSSNTAKHGVDAVTSSDDASSDSLTALQKLQEITYRDGTTAIYYAKTVIPGSQSKSSGKYDVGAVVNIYFTITGTAPFFADATTVVDRVTTTINDANSNPIYVTKIEMFYHGFLSPNDPQYDRSSTINNPSNNTTYTLYAYDPTSYYTSGFSSVYGGAILTFSDGTKLGNSYELTIVLY